MCLCLLVSEGERGRDVPLSVVSLTWTVGLPRESRRWAEVMAVMYEGIFGYLIVFVSFAGALVER